MYPYFLSLFFYARRNPGEIDRAWRCHELVRPISRWSIVSLYLLAGAVFSFCTFGGVHVGLRTGNPLVQYVAVGAIVSIGLVHIFARKMTTPVFDRYEVPQRDRREAHAFWMAFMMLGIGLGLLPMLLPVK